MKITQDVRDYAEGLSENEKAALYPDEAQAGMEDMSKKFAELGGQLYLSEDGSVRKDID